MPRTNISLALTVVSGIRQWLLLTGFHKHTGKDRIVEDLSPSDLKTILHSKRANIYYLQHCRVLVKGGRVEYVTDKGRRVRSTGPFIEIFGLRTR